MTNDQISLKMTDNVNNLSLYILFLLILLSPVSTIKFNSKDQNLIVEDEKKKKDEDKLGHDPDGFQEDKFDDDLLKKLFVQRFNDHNLSIDRLIMPTKTTAEDFEYFLPTRIKGTQELIITCYQCQGSMRGEKSCYRGGGSSVNCLGSAQCYTEIHPNYIRRGCIVQDRINHTFYCKCPVCNDKPFSEFVYFNYNTLDEWEYDNIRLALPSTDPRHMMCKSCDTKKEGTRNLIGMSCREGQNAEQKQCEENEVCYTNINYQLSYVKRGCIKKPVYNSIFFHCNQSLCNNQTFNEKKISLQSEEKQLLLMHFQKRNMKQDLVALKNILKVQKVSSSIFLRAEFYFFVFTVLFSCILKYF